MGALERCLAPLGRAADRLAAALVGPRRRRVGALLLVLVGLFYAFTAAGNLAETDDVFAFAWRAENVPASTVDDPRLLGYHLLARGTWLAAQALGLGWVRGLDVLRALSWLGALVTLALLWRLLQREIAAAAVRETVAAAIALLACAALALCYGFWRYAVEGDVYALALALTVATLHAVLGLPRAAAMATPAALACGLLAGIGVLVYQPNAIALLLVFPGLIAARCGLRTAAVYTAAAAALVGAGYGAAFAVGWPEPASVAAFRQFLGQRSQEFLLDPLSLRTLVVSALRSVFALGHDVLSSNWAFGLPPLQALAGRMFGAHDLADELFSAGHAGAWVWLGGVTWIAAGAALLALGLRRWRTASAGLGGGVGELRLAVLAWIGLTAVVIGRLNPGGIEAWILLLLPLVLWLALSVMAAEVRSHGSAVAAAAVLLLGLHNAVGGMALVWSPASDRVGISCRAAAAAVGRTDLVLVLRQRDVAECLRYGARVETYTINGHGLQVLHELLAKPGSDGVVHAIDRWGHAGVDVNARLRRTEAAGGRIWLLQPPWPAAPRLLSGPRPRSEPAADPR